MRSAAVRLLLIPLITATIALTGCTPKTSLVDLPLYFQTPVIT